MDTKLRERTSLVQRGPDPGAGDDVAGVTDLSPGVVPVHGAGGEPTPAPALSLHRGSVTNVSKTQSLEPHPSQSFHLHTEAQRSRGKKGSPGTSEGSAGTCWDEEKAGGVQSRSDQGAASQNQEGHAVDTGSECRAWHPGH